MRFNADTTTADIKRACSDGRTIREPTAKGAMYATRNSETDTAFPTLGMTSSTYR